METAKISSERICIKFMRNFRYKNMKVDSLSFRSYKLFVQNFACDKQAKAKQSFPVVVQTS